MTDITGGGIYCAAVSSFAALRMRCAPCGQRGGTCPLFNLKTAPDRFRSGALITRYHPASAANRGPWGPLTGPAVPPYCGFRRKTPGPVYRRLPHRLTPAAGSLWAGYPGFLPIKVANGFYFMRLLGVCQGKSGNSSAFSTGVIDSPG